MKKIRKKRCESPTLIPDEFENVNITLQKFLQIAEVMTFFNHRKIGLFIKNLWEEEFGWLG